jgi:hypothetical protein
MCAGTSSVRPIGQKHIATVLTAEGRWVYVVTRKRRSRRLTGTARNLLFKKKNGKAGQFVLEEHFLTMSSFFKASL